MKTSLDIDQIENGDVIIFIDKDGTLKFLDKVATIEYFDGVFRCNSAKTGNKVHFIPNVTIHDGSEFELALGQVMGAA